MKKQNSSLAFIAGLMSVLIAVPLISQVGAAERSAFVMKKAAPGYSVECIKALAAKDAAYLETADENVAQQKLITETHMNALMAATELSEAAPRAKAVMQADMEFAKATTKIIMSSIDKSVLEAVGKACKRMEMPRSGSGMQLPREDMKPMPRVGSGKNMLEIFRKQTDDQREMRKPEFEMKRQDMRMMEERKEER